MIVWISDLDLRGSGYKNISVELCKGLVDAGHEVKVLGIAYNAQEHPWKFSIIPVPVAGGAVSLAATALRNLLGIGVKIDAVVVALDIPLHDAFLQMPLNGIPYIGIFPIESGPLSRTWAQMLMKMNRQLVISEFGTKAANDAGVPAVHIPIGIDLESWRPPTAFEREKIRMSMGFEDDEMVVLQVADNHERKNLSAGFEIVSEAKKAGLKIKYCLVSRINFRAGYNVHDLASTYGLESDFMGFERGLPFEKLYGLFAAADAFLLTSKAEGLGMPVLEAMACKVPVVATDCTAITDHIKDGRGLPIEPGFWFTDPFGNSRRCFPSIQSGVARLAELNTMKAEDRASMVDAAYEYVKARTWARANEVLQETLTPLLEERRYLAPPEIPSTDVTIY